MHSPANRPTHLPTSSNRAALRSLQGSIRAHQRAKRVAEVLEQHADPGGRAVTVKLRLATCGCPGPPRVAPAGATASAIVCGICSKPLRSPKA